MSKLSFRARALDASKQMPIYLAEELPDLPDYSAINRAVPQMPSGMEKEEECEHHLQRAICTGLIIPTPEVMEVPDVVAYDRLYPADYKMPRQLIHMQPLGLEQDVPDYDMDSEDEKWLKKQQTAAGARRCELTELKFEETMERLERSSGQTVVTLREARALAGKSGPAEHLLAAVYDYWLNKRLVTQQPLLLAVRTEARPGAPSPYLAFRRRTEKMQTRKNRKNDESSYEKMVKLRRELSRAVSLLELVKRRERAKRELLRMAALLVDKRYQARDYSGQMLAEAAAQRRRVNNGVKCSRVSVPAPILAPAFTAPLHHRPPSDPVARQREKRQYKRRKHRHHSSVAQPHTLHHGVVSGSSSSSEGEAAEAAPPPDPSGPFAFRRKPGCQYHMPTASFGPSTEAPWRSGCAKENTFPGDSDQRLRYTLTSLRHPTSRFIGLARRRVGRGGRVNLDRLSTTESLDRLWEAMDFTIIDSHSPNFNAARSNDSNKPLSTDPCLTDDAATKEKLVSLDSNNSSVKSDLDATTKTAKTLDDEVNDRRRLPEVIIKTESIEDRSIAATGSRSYSNKNDWNFTTDDVRFKTEPTDMTGFNEHIERIIKTEADDDSVNIDFGNDYETLQNSISGCVSIVSGKNNIIDNSFTNSNSYHCKSPNNNVTRWSNDNEREDFLNRADIGPDNNDGWRENGAAKGREDRTEFRISRADWRRMTELFVKRGLQRYESKGRTKTANEVDEIFTDCVHFRPQSPPPVLLPATSPLRDPSDGNVRLTEGAPITVQVLPPIAEAPSDIIFKDTSLYTTSEFTLSDLYGDSLLPESIDNMEPKTSWIHTNGPDKPDTNSDSVSDSSKSLTVTTFKDNSSSLTENSSSNHTSVFTPSDGTPNSLNSCDDSNHAIAGTNGVEWNNDSNGSEKIVKFDKVNSDELKINEKRLGSSVFTVRSFENDKQIFLASDKTYHPVSPPQATPAPHQGIFIPISTGQTIKKRPEGQGMAVVQVRTPSVVRQVIGRVGADGISRPPLLVSAQHVKTLPSGHKVVQGQKVVQQGQKIVHAGQKIVQAGHNAVNKVLQQQIGRKLQQDAARRLGNEEQIIVSGGAAQLMGQQVSQQQQLVTMPVSEPLKLRLQGHLLASAPNTGVVGQPGRRAVVQLAPGTGTVINSSSLTGVTSSPTLTGAMGSAVASGAGGTQVKVVRTLTAAQRSRLRHPTSIQNLAGVLQLHMRPNTSYNSEIIDGRTALINDTSSTNSTITNAVIVPQQNPTSAGNAASIVVNSAQNPSTPQNPGSSGPAGQPSRKGPMEVT